MPITDWPAAERPREKLLQRGAAALSDAELLAIFLRTGYAGINAVDLSRQLLQQTGSLRALLNCSHQEFCAYKGLGEAKFVQLQAVMEMAKRHYAESLGRNVQLTSPLQTRKYLQASLRDYQQEVFACLMLDNKHRIIALRKMFHGTISSASVYPREVVKQALSDNAAAIILAHNHPSGIAEPSQSDRDITRRLQEALALVDVRVLDHFVIGDDVVSFAERGLM